MHILEARLKRDTETFGKMDPYVVINTRMQRCRTKTKDNAGKHPKWQGECMDVDVKYIGDDMHIEVFDEDPCDSDLVGETTIKLSALAVNGGLDEWFGIQYKGKAAGDIHLRAEWHPRGEALQQRPAGQVMAAPPMTYTNG